MKTRIGARTILNALEVEMAETYTPDPLHCPARDGQIHSPVSNYGNVVKCWGCGVTFRDAQAATVWNTWTAPARAARAARLEGQK